jgi:hypothetical protein
MSIESVRLIIRDGLAGGTIDWPAMEDLELDSVSNEAKVFAFLYGVFYLANGGPPSVRPGFTIDDEVQLAVAMVDEEFGRHFVTRH